MKDLDLNEHTSIKSSVIFRILLTHFVKKKNSTRTNKKKQQKKKTNKHTNKQTKQKQTKQNKTNKQTKNKNKTKKKTTTTKP